MYSSGGSEAGGGGPSNVGNYNHVTGSRHSNEGGYVNTPQPPPNRGGGSRYGSAAGASRYSNDIGAPVGSMGNTVPINNASMYPATTTTNAPYIGGGNGSVNYNYRDRR
uniref:Uncharacterized protein n=1 Tax=Lygus hesperus TaxID=30085 RepID=A0A0A9XXV8_LYGHE